MRKINRSIANYPECLSRLSHPANNWDDMNLHQRKKKVWNEIDKIQSHLCAYCELPAYKGKTTGHIEHFFDKGNPLYKQLTFDWNNLFGCCQSNAHCGHYKDQLLPGGQQRQYNSSLLLKPDIDDPEEYLQFLPSGVIQEKKGLDPHKLCRATETINALNLKCSTLKNSRESQITIYKNRLLPLTELMEDMTDEDYEEYLAIKSEAMTVPHRTAIKQAISWL